MTSSEESGSAIGRFIWQWVAIFLYLIPFWMGLLVMFTMLKFGYTDTLAYTGAVVTCFGMYGLVGIGILNRRPL